jgi:8-oxo-dGTP diphosphatase
MIFTKTEYTIKAKDKFLDYFHTSVVPYKKKYGALLIGSWANETNETITVIWQYENKNAISKIKQKLSEDESYIATKESREIIAKSLILKINEELLTSTGDYLPTTFTIAVSGYITNEHGEVLLVKSLGREDTWEIPGGRVESGESLVDAVKREIKEEANVDVSITNAVGVYQNVNRNLIVVTFRGTYVSGELKAQEGEIKDVTFKLLDRENIDQWITREPIKNRVLDAMNGKCATLEILTYDPYQLLLKLNGDCREDVGVC